MAKRLRLQITDGTKRVDLSADIDSLTYQIVNDNGEALSPDVLVENGKRWLQLSDYPDAPGSTSWQAGRLKPSSLAMLRCARWLQTVFFALVVRGSLRR